MNSIDEKGLKLFYEWADRNENVNIFKEDRKKDSFYVEHFQDNTGIWKYEFNSIQEAEDTIVSVLGEKMEPEIKKLVIISAFKCKRMYKKDLNDNKVTSKEEGKGLPEYIYVF